MAGHRVLEHCAGCPRSNVLHHARGLCSTCYSWHLDHGMLHLYAGLPHPPRPRKPRQARSTLIGHYGEPPDELDVEACLGGKLSARLLTTASREQVVRALAAKGLTDAAIEIQTGWFKRGGKPGTAVAKFRHRLGILPGRPRASWSYR